MESTQKPVLVTGATGYVAAHTIKQLLEQGFKVRGTVRSVAKKERNQFLYNLVPEKSSNLELVEADLLKPESWLSAVEGCDYVLHIASPIPMNVPKDENLLIKPAVEGTLNVLKAAVKKGVKKVVITSGCLTRMVGNGWRKIVTENWSDESKCDAYTKSKIRAEKAAWKFYEENKGKIEVVSIIPGFILGPPLTAMDGSSESFMKMVMTGKMPGMPNISAGISDVRDVAEAHINRYRWVKAMLLPNNGGKQYITAVKTMWFKDLARITREEFGKYGYKVTKGSIPNCLISFAAIFSKQARGVKVMLGTWWEIDCELAKRELKINWIEPEQTMKDMGYSLIRLGIVPNRVAKYELQNVVKK